jgi:hypothetical protein
LGKLEVGPVSQQSPDKEEQEAKEAMPDSEEIGGASKNRLNALPERATGRLALTDCGGRNISFVQSSEFKKAKAASFLNSAMDFNAGLKSVRFVAQAQGA